MAITLNGTTGITSPDINVTAQTTGFTTTGNLTAADLTLSGGVYIGGTGAANLLDDYEEGTWLPQWRFGGNSVGMTMGAQDGRYTKIGNRVFITCYTSIYVKGSSTGSFSISGLPYISSTAGPYSNMAIWGNTLNSISGHLQGYVAPSSNLISELTMLGTGAISALTDSNMNASADFMFNFNYQTDS
jgi:hypothetical protein